MPKQNSDIPFDEIFAPACPYCDDRTPYITKSKDGKKTYARCKCGKTIAFCHNARTTIQKAWFKVLDTERKEREAKLGQRKKNARRRLHR